MKKYIGPIIAAIVMLVLAIGWLGVIRSIDYSRMLSSEDLKKAKTEAPAATPAEAPSQVSPAPPAP